MRILGDGGEPSKHFDDEAANLGEVLGKRRRRAPRESQAGRLTILLRVTSESPGAGFACACACSGVQEEQGFRRDPLLTTG
jgi:hypothetical protein